MRQSFDPAWLGSLTNKLANQFLAVARTRTHSVFNGRVVASDYLEGAKDMFNRLASADQDDAIYLKTEWDGDEELFQLNILAEDNYNGREFHTGQILEFIELRALAASQTKVVTLEKKVSSLENFINGQRDRIQELEAIVNRLNQIPAAGVQ